MHLEKPKLKLQGFPKSFILNQRLKYNPSFCKFHAASIFVAERKSELRLLKGVKVRT